jgi:hypothetical protein
VGAVTWLRDLLADVQAWLSKDPDQLHSAMERLVVRTSQRLGRVAYWPHDCTVREVRMVARHWQVQAEIQHRAAARERAGRERAEDFIRSLGAIGLFYRQEERWTWGDMDPRAVPTPPIEPEERAS